MMIAYPLVAPERISAPTEFFLCEHYHCQIAAGVCVARQRATYLHKKSKATWAGKPRFEYCASGTCPQGNTIAVHLDEQPGPRTVSSLVPFRRRRPAPAPASALEHPPPAPPAVMRVDPCQHASSQVDTEVPARPKVCRRRRRRTFVDRILEQLERRLRLGSRRLQ